MKLKIATDEERKMYYNIICVLLSFIVFVLGSLVVVGKIIQSGLLNLFTIYLVSFAIVLCALLALYLYWQLTKRG